MVAEHHSKAEAATRKCPDSNSFAAIGKEIRFRDCAALAIQQNSSGFHSVRSAFMGWTDAAR